MNSNRIALTCLLVISLAFYLLSPDATAEKLCYGRFDGSFPPHGLHIIDTDSMIDRTVWTYGSTKPGSECIAGDWALSPDTKMIAFLEGYIDESSFQVNYLRVLSFGIQGAREIAKCVRDFAWSPDSASIAYTTEKQVSDTEIVDRETWVHDLKTQQTRKLVSEGGNVYWATSDAAIYLQSCGYEWEGPVVRVDPSSGKVDETQFFSVNFSPDEHYYWYLDDGASLRVALRKTNENWFLNPACKVAPWQYRFSPERWLNTTTISSARIPWAARRGVPRACYMLDVETGELRQSPYYLLGLIDNGTRVVEIIREGEFQIRKVSDLEVFTEEEAKKMENATAEKPYVPPVK